MRWLLLTMTSLVTLPFFSKEEVKKETQKAPTIVFVEKEIIKEISIDADTVIRPFGLPVPANKLKKELENCSGFGYRTHPVFKTRKMHTGIDIGCPKNTSVLSTAFGTIVRIQYRADGYGNNIVIEHQDGYKTLYAHLNEISVKVGELVKHGQVIGYSGNTGTSTSPHLHYEVVHNNEKVDPLPFMKDYNKTHKKYIQAVS